MPTLKGEIVGEFLGILTPATMTDFRTWQGGLQGDLLPSPSCGPVGLLLNPGREEGQDQEEPTEWHGRAAKGLNV